MTEYALVNPDDDVDRFATNVDPDVGTKTGWRWLPVERIDDVPGQGQILDPPAIAVLADRVTVTRAARNKTAQEIDDEKTALVATINGPGLLFKIVLNHENRIRALEGRPAIDAVQLRAALKAMI